MATIRLIVTGDLEELALHESLRRVFGDSRHDGEEVIWDPPHKLHGATSRRLLTSERPPRPIRELVRVMLDEVLIGKHDSPADLVLVIDDVELDNIDQEVVIAGHFKSALEEALATRLKDRSLQVRERSRERVRERCSFHLLRPMVESYFFGDIDALRSMGARSTPLLRHIDVERSETDSTSSASPERARLLPHVDVENFETIDTDPGWLEECRISNERQHRERPWWRHERHPKHYLEHLLNREGLLYDEKIHGESALQNLDWEHVPKADADCAVVRCLFEDLADWFGVANPLGPGDMQECLYPLRSVDRSKLLLRNM